MVQIRAKSAFTIVELAFSIALTAILAVEVLPRFFDITTFSQSLFEQQALNVLNYAQSLAIGSGCHISVTTTSTTIISNLRASCTTGLFNQAVYDPANISNLLIKTAPADVAITNTNFPIYFDSNGQARSVSGGGIVNATLTINGKVITIRGSTGTISG